MYVLMAYFYGDVAQIIFMVLQSANNSDNLIVAATVLSCRLSSHF